jgi:hypothetical protein
MTRDDDGERIPAERLPDRAWRRCQVVGLFRRRRSRLARMVRATSYTR